MKAHPAAPHKDISWPDVYFAATANREKFEDVNIVTLKSYVTEKAYDKAIAQLGPENATLLRERACEILNMGAVAGGEHVDITSDGIHVVLDCDIIDDDSLWAALNMLSSALERLDGKYGRIYFSTPVTYKSADIPWLHLH